MINITHDEWAKKEQPQRHTCGPGFHIPENPFGTLGAVIPFLAVLGLVIAPRKT